MLAEGDVARPELVVARLTVRGEGRVEAILHAHEVETPLEETLLLPAAPDRKVILLKELVLRQAPQPRDEVRVAAPARHEGVVGAVKIGVRVRDLGQELVADDGLKGGVERHHVVHAVELILFPAEVPGLREADAEIIRQVHGHAQGLGVRLEVAVIRPEVLGRGDRGVDLQVRVVIGEPEPAQGGQPQAVGVAREEGERVIPVALGKVIRHGAGIEVARPPLRQPRALLPPGVVIGKPQGVVRDHGLVLIRDGIDAQVIRRVVVFDPELAQRQELPADLLGGDVEDVGKGGVHRRGRRAAVHDLDLRQGHGVAVGEGPDDLIDRLAGIGPVLELELRRVSAGAVQCEGTGLAREAPRIDGDVGVRLDMGEPHPVQVLRVHVHAYPVVDARVIGIVLGLAEEDAVVLFIQVGVRLPPDELRLLGAHAHGHLIHAAHAHVIADGPPRLCLSLFFPKGRRHLPRKESGRLRLRDTGPFGLGLIQGDRHDPDARETKPVLDLLDVGGRLRVHGVHEQDLVEPLEGVVVEPLVVTIEGDRKEKLRRRRRPCHPRRHKKHQDEDQCEGLLELHNGRHLLFHQPLQHFFFQLFQNERLVDTGLHVQRLERVKQLFILDAGHDDHRHAVAGLADALERLDAVYAGHAHVQEHQVGLLAMQYLQGLLPALGREHLDLPALKEILQIFADVQLIIDDHQTRHKPSPTRLMSKQKLWHNSTTIFV